MTCEELIAALGIEVSRGPWNARVIGYPPTQYSMLTMRDGRPIVWISAGRGLAGWVAGIHEALHAMMGPSSLDGDEIDLMAVEWAVCQELEGREFRTWRNEFAHYGLGNGSDIGSDDDFLTSEHWAQCVAAAKASGSLTPDGSVVWGRGPSPAWPSYIDDLIRRGQRPEMEMIL